jgi:acetyl esterase
VTSLDPLGLRSEYKCRYFENTGLINHFMKNHFFLLFTITLLCFTRSFSAMLNNFEVTKNVEWAKPNGHSLTMDIYVPQTGETKYPVIIIYHGGGWLIHNNSTMDSMATYIVQHSEYVVCNVNYRLLSDDNNSILMNQIVEDAMGAVLWAKDHIGEFHGDSSDVGLTGDSAGGQLAAMVMLCSNKLSSQRSSGNSLTFNPTYLPKNISAEEIVRRDLLSVKAVVLSYPATDLFALCKKKFESRLNIFWMLAQQTPRGIFGDSISVTTDPELYKAVSPFYNIPNSKERVLPPQLVLIGSLDIIIAPSSVKEYVALVKGKNQPVEFWEYSGQPHAFLSSEKNFVLGTEFRKDAPAAIDRIITFFNTHLKK